MSDKKIPVEKLLAKGIEAPKISVDDNQTDIQLVSENEDFNQIVNMEAFMNEPVKIRLAMSTDINATPYAVVTVNGIENRAVIPRGEIVTVKRMHMEVLARMKETRYTQPHLTNLNNIDMANHLAAKTMLVYPFEVIEDKNPKGRAWLENILAEPSY